MELCLFSRVYRDLPLEEAVHKTKSHGFGSIELAANWQSPHFDIERALEEEYRERVQSLMAGASMHIQALALHRDSQLVLGPHGKSTAHFHPEVEFCAEYGTRRMKLAARVAGAYGIPVVVGYLGCPDFSQWYPWPSAGGWREQLSLMEERWMPVLEEFRNCRVRFAHEVAPQQLAYNIETAREVLQVLDIDSFGFCLDPSNMVQAGVDIRFFIDIFGDRIFHVHGKDAEITHYYPLSGLMAHGDFNRKERGVRFRIPGWGSTDWKQVLSSLKLNRYDGVISLEIEDPVVGGEEAIIKARDFLQPLLFW